MLVALITTRRSVLYLTVNNTGCIFLFLSFVEKVTDHNFAWSGYSVYTVKKGCWSYTFKGVVSLV